MIGVPAANKMSSIVQVSYNVSDSESEGRTVDNIEEVDVKVEPVDDDDKHGVQSVDESMGDSQDEEDTPIGHKGLANVMAKILVKKTPTESSVILSKGQTDKELAKTLKKKEKTTVGFEVVKSETGDSVTEKPDEPQNEDEKEPVKKKDKLVKKKSWEDMGRVQPNVLLREKERNLQRIATKGVVQLFNAVRKQQGLLKEKLEDAGGSVNRRDKVMQTMTKGKFMDILKDTASPAKKVKKESKVKSESMDTDVAEKPSWGVLRDDFLMGSKMSNWDREDAEASDDEGSGPEQGINDSDLDT